MNSRSKLKRVLAMDPSTRGFGFAVMEGAQRAIDWGVKSTAADDKNAACLEQITYLIERYRPDVLVVEDLEDSQRHERVQQLMRDIAELASKRKLKVHSFSRLTVREVFSRFGAVTKHQLATLIAQRLPELAPRLPPPRKPWMSEDYRMSIFNAVAFALTFYYFENKRRRASH